VSNELQKRYMPSPSAVATGSARFAAVLGYCFFSENSIPSANSFMSRFAR
jgi:hypothetical protein